VDDFDPTAKCFCVTVSGARLAALGYAVAMPFGVFD